jgi:hypothetical protein
MQREDTYETRKRRRATFGGTVFGMTCQVFLQKKQQRPPSKMNNMDILLENKIGKKTKDDFACLGCNDTDKQKERN